MAEDSVERKLRAILAADVVGYSRLMSKDEEGTLAALKSHRADFIDPIIEEHRGRIVKLMGDGILIEFASVVDALKCAIAVQRGMLERNTKVPKDRQIVFRIGINLGDIIIDGDDIYGNGVNVAARLETLAEPGGICISGRVFNQVEKNVEVGFAFLGPQSVKNIDKPINTYKVLLDPEAAGMLVDAPRVKTQGRRHMVLVGVVLVLALMVVGYWYQHSKPEIEPASVEKMALLLPDKPSIAVLAFDNLSGDPEQDYIANGISENITTALSYIPELFVISRNSSFSYKGKPVKIRQVSEELGVQYVLEGSVLKSGNKVRITAQLIDALSGGHIWSERYDRDLNDLFNLLDEITQAITVALQVKLTHGEQARMWYSSTRNLEAWRYVVQGFAIFNNFTKDAMANSRALFKKAVELDPEYAHAVTMLAWTHKIDAQFGHSDSSDESLARALELAKKSVAMNDKDPNVHSLLSLINVIQGQYDRALEDGRKAIALGPSEAEAHMLFGEALIKSGMFEEAVQMCEKAMRLHPHTPLYYFGHMALAYYWAGRYDESLAMAKKLIIRSRKVGYEGGVRWGLWLSALALMELDRESEARELIAQAVREWPQRNTPDQLRRSIIYLHYKDPAHSQRIFDSLRKAGFPEHDPLQLPDKPSIAVLAFDNLSGDPEQEYFSDGISENIITALSKVGELFVIARNSSFTYKGKPVKIQQVSRELGVRYVLEGSVQKSGDRLRITAQLVDAINGQHLWAEIYDRDLKDIFEIQDEITRKIITSLRVKLTEGDQARIPNKKLKNFEAFMKRIQALSLFRESTKESMVRFGQLAQEIIDIEPESSVGHRLLGWHHWRLVMRGMSKSPQESIEKAFGLAQKSLSLDESDSMSHGLLGSIYLAMRKHDQAIKSGKRAIELDPNGAMVHGLLGMTLNFAGEFDEAITYLNYAIRLNPFPPWWYYWYLGMAYWNKGQCEDALKEQKKALQLHPNAVYIYIEIVVNYVCLDRQVEAEAAAKKVIELYPKYSIGRVLKNLSFKNQVDYDARVDALRKAGLPE